ncbi:MAG: hypothetical protein HOA17_06045 [Candidatus Melainabacteria bacterium]|jgi:hypothetical protein|nr:hypothetical protein [Candidatus Melainabacteria bacterium]
MIQLCDRFLIKHKKNLQLSLYLIPFSWAETRSESIETVSPEEAEALLENSEPVYHRNNGFDKLQELHQPALQPALKEVPLPKAA